MNPDSTPSVCSASSAVLQYFDQISEAPDAISRLRRFILDLAVRGKLVEQDLDDEPAAELLKRIEEEKSRLISVGDLRNQKSQPLNEDQIPFDIPPNWVWSQISQIGIINPRNDADGFVEASFVPMPLIFADYKKVNQHEVRSWGEIKTGFTHFAEGDVGLAKITPCFENGKSTIFRNLIGGIGAGTTELHIVRPILIAAGYILIFLKSPHFIETGIPKMTGTAGQKRVPRDYFAFSPFPLPPLAEQHRIVVKVDELMKLCDELEAAQQKRGRRRDRLITASLAKLTDETENKSILKFSVSSACSAVSRPEHIHQLRQTIFNLAIRGKLVPQDPKDEPATSLIKHIEDEKKLLPIEEKINNQKVLPKVSQEEISFKAPSSWTWVRLLSLCEIITKGSSPRWQGINYTDEKNGVLFITSENVGQFHLLLEKKKYVQKQFNKIEPRSILAKNDILLNIVGASIGRSALFNLDEIANINQAVCIVRTISRGKLLDLRYILLFLNSEFGVKYMLDKQVDMARANLSMTNVGMAPVPLPPLTEQHRIVNKVDGLMALCNELEAHLDTTMTTRHQLLEATLHEVLS